MAVFRLRDDAEKWFKNIDKATKFDLYYFCVIMGLLNNRRNDPVGVDSTDMVSYFVNDYKPFQNLIIGLLIISELKKAGIQLSERDAVRKEIQSLVSTQSPTGLSDRGVHILNQYASGGFEILRDHHASKPETREEFMISFIEIVGDAANSLVF